MPISSTNLPALGFTTARRASSNSRHLNALDFWTHPNVVTANTLTQSQRYLCTDCASKIRPRQRCLPGAASYPGSFYRFPLREYLNRGISDAGPLRQILPRRPANSRLASTAKDRRSNRDGNSYNISKTEGKRLGDIYGHDKSSLYDKTKHPVLQTLNLEEPPVARPSTYTHWQSWDDSTDLLGRLSSALNDKGASEDGIWHLYQQLPEPRASHAPQLTRNFMSRLRVVRHKTTNRMMRYLALISDLRSCGLQVPKGAWNVAMSYAGRCLNKTTSKQLDSAVDIWHEMEHSARVDSTIVTFNLLFDVAIKAGKFGFAESVLQELKSRGLKLNRHFRTSIIYYYGLREDGAGVRQAYADLVEADEIVDTAVINCVIAALIKCKEPGAAEMFFESAKQLHASKSNPPLPPQHWHSKRQLGKKLDLAAQKHREAIEQASVEGQDPESRIEELKESTSIAPDSTTYRLLIHYYAVQAGDIERAAELIDEMGEFNVPVEGNIFLWLFYAFATHGGKPYTPWTWRRLESTWEAFISSVDESAASSVDPAVPSANHDNKASQPFFDPDDNVRRWARQPDGEVVEQTQDTPFIESDQNYSSLSSDDMADKEEEPEDDAAESIEFDNMEEIPPIFKNNLYVGFAEDAADRGVYIGRVMALQVGLAFARCSHLSRTIHIWLEVKKRWRPEVANDIDEVEAEIAALFPQPRLFFIGLVTGEENGRDGP